MDKRIRDENLVIKQEFVKDFHRSRPEFFAVVDQLLALGWHPTDVAHFLAQEIDTHVTGEILRRQSENYRRRRQGFQIQHRT